MKDGDWLESCGRGIWSCLHPLVLEGVPGGELLQATSGSERLTAQLRLEFGASSPVEAGSKRTLQSAASNHIVCRGIGSEDPGNFNALSTLATNPNSRTRP